MVDVTLINPCFHSDIGKCRSFGNIVPLGLLYLGTMLESNGYKVEILDMRTFPIQNSQSTLKLLNEKIKKNSICVGISVMMAQVEHGLQISKYVKTIRPLTPIVWGGWHPTLYPKQTCANPYIDYIIQGEGEHSFLELVKSIERETSPNHINGLGYKKRKIVKVNPLGKPIDLNTLPLPAWHLLNISKYIYRQRPFSERPLKGLDIISSRGCPHRCTFCINTVFHQLHNWRAQTPEKTVSEIEFLVNEFKIEHVSFMDENVFVDKKRVSRICDLLLERKLDIYWFANIRADYFCSPISESLLKKCADCGLREVGIGAESGSNKTLNFLKKDITTEHLLTSARICHKLGILPRYSFMIGLPYETKDDMMATMFLIKRLCRICPGAERALIGPQIYRPYPGSQLYELCKILGFKEAKSLREWANFLSEKGNFDPKNFPWIKDIEFVLGISRHAKASRIGLKELLVSKRFLKAFWALISKARTNLHFYKWPIEVSLYLKMKRHLANRIKREKMKE